MFYELIHSGSPEYCKTEYGTNFSFPPHMHQCFELITVRSGEMTVVVQEQTYCLRAGEGLLIFPNQIHSLSSRTCSHMLCIFSPHLVSAYWSNIRAKRPENPVFRPSEQILALLDQLNSDTPVLSKKGVLYLLCSDFDRAARYVAQDSDRRNLLAEIFRFIEANFSRDCTLSTLAQSLGYDYTYLSRYFKRTVGISFHEYVSIYRLNNACDLLRNSGQTVLHCALESGHDSLRSFNRNFKKHFGITPSAYVKQHRKLEKTNS